MSCNYCAITAEKVAPDVGAGHIEAAWSENRIQPQQCPACGAFLRRDGGCTRCEAEEFAENVRVMAEMSGDAAREPEWEPDPDEPEFTAMAIAAVKGGKVLTWEDENDYGAVRRELSYDQKEGRFAVESFYLELQGRYIPGGYYTPPEYPELVDSDQEYHTYGSYEEAFAALQEAI